jgi:acylpyruvate hydrolase
MQLATSRGGDRATRVVRIDGGSAVEVGARDMGELLTHRDWQTRAAEAVGPEHEVDGLDFAPLVPRPEKIFCVGLNYRTHIAEMGRDLPEHPTLFAKYARALIGAHDDITLPAVSSRVDWEAELAVVIGRPTRHADEATARASIAGYAVLNDITARDYQRRTSEWLQGKTFEGTTPLGPVLVTADEIEEAGDGELGFDLTCEVNGRTVQKANTSDLLFGPAALVAYLSDIITLVPGDVIATGTPGGVGDAARPQVYLADGDVLVTRIDGLGECRNVCRRERLGT